MNTFLLFSVLFTIALALNKTLPHRTLGMYLLLADDTVPGYTSNDNWQPELPNYLQTGANVLFFAFLNPNMKVPPSFTNLAKTRGTGSKGAIPSNTLIIFSVGGEEYSNHPNPWPWLTSTQAANTMAEEVATWNTKYGCDGIDLDIETGAGDAANAGENLMTFVKTLKSLNPNFIITQPVYGYPQVTAETYIVNHSWDVNSRPTNGVDAVGLMVYEATESLSYVKNYAQGAQQWQGFPITVDVATDSILCGLGGSSSSASISTVASGVKAQNLGGIMVWFASVIDSKTGKTAYQYAGGSGDASVAGSGDWAKAIGQMG